MMKYVIAAVAGALGSQFLSPPVVGLLKKNDTTKKVLGKGRVDGAVGALVAVVALAMLSRG